MMSDQENHGIQSNDGRGPVDDSNARAIGDEAETTPSSSPSHPAGPQPQPRDDRRPQPLPSESPLRRPVKTPSGRELDSSDVCDLTRVPQPLLDCSVRDSEATSSVAHSEFSDEEEEERERGGSGGGGGGHGGRERSGDGHRWEETQLRTTNRFGDYGRGYAGLMSSDNSVGSSIVEDVCEDDDDDDDDDDDGEEDDKLGFLPAAVPIEGNSTEATDRFKSATAETGGVPSWESVRKGGDAESEEASKEMRQRNKERIQSLRKIIGAGIECVEGKKEDGGRGRRIGRGRLGSDGNGSSSSSSSSSGSGSNSSGSSSSGSSSSDNNHRSQSSGKMDIAKVSKHGDSAQNIYDANTPTKPSGHVANPQRRNLYTPQQSLDLKDLALDTTTLEEYDGGYAKEEGDDDDGSLVSLVTVDTREELERLKGSSEVGGFDGRGSRSNEEEEEEENAAAEYLREDDDDYHLDENIDNHARLDSRRLVDTAEGKSSDHPYDQNQRRTNCNKNRRNAEEDRPSFPSSSSVTSTTSSTQTAKQKQKKLRVSFTDESGMESLTKEIPDRPRGIHRWTKQPFSKRSHRNKNAAASRFPALQFRKSRAAKAATFEERGGCGGSGSTTTSHEESAASGWKSADLERGGTIGGTGMGGGARLVASSNKSTENTKGIDDGEISIFSGGTSLYSGGSGSTIISTNTEYGSLLKDTYSFIYIYRGCPMTYPFAYAMLIFLFQAAVYMLLLRSLVDFGSPYNPLKVPAVASVELRMAQVLALVIAVASAVDIMVAMNNLLRPPDAIVVLDTPMDSHRHSPRHIPGGDGSTTTASGSTGSGPPTIPVGFRFMLGNVLRLIEGYFAVATTFILIVQAPNVIELFINFAALDFIVNIDNLAFSLAEHGMVNDNIQFAAKYVDGLGLEYLENPLTSRRSRKRRNACASAASVDRAGRLSSIKSNFIFRLFKAPAKLLRSRPDATRRFTLMIMFLIMFSSWSIITFEQNNQFDYLCKSIHVEFYHDHLMGMDGSIKPFLTSRSGTYTAMFENSKSYLEWLSDMTSQEKKILAYKKADDYIQPPLIDTGNVEQFAPPKFVNLAIYDPNFLKWIFLTCDSTSDWRLDRTSNCVGPEVYSVETPNMDITSLASSAFILADGKEEESSVVLPASISCNECSSQNPGDYQLVGSGNSMVCDLSGGRCSSPNPEFGWSRTCSCPSGQYGIFCDKLLKATCPILEFEPEVVPVTKDGSAISIQRLELEPFKLKSDEHGVDNSPIWERTRDGVDGQFDRVERRGGTHWTITRFKSDSSTRTIAMAIDQEATDGVAPAAGTLKGLELQPQPAGLEWFFPKVTEWGTVPDLERPYDLYRLRCRAYGERADMD